jgi:hypothetical protein
MGLLFIDMGIKTFGSYLRTTKTTPSTREEWMLPCQILANLMIQLKFAEYKMEEVLEFKRKIDGNPQILDYGKAGMGLKTTK